MISYQVMEHGRPLQKVMQETPKPTGTEVLVRITRSHAMFQSLTRRKKTSPISS